jgi:small GTP-binding protein
MTVPASTSSLAIALERVRSDGEGLLPRERLADLDSAALRLRHDRCNVVLLGAFKRGKSTLVNALVGRDVLPTGVVPITSVATTVRYEASERLIVRFADGHAETRPLDALGRFVTEPGDASNELVVAAVEVGLPAPLLAGGLQLVDTPGIASVHDHNTRAAYEALGRVDAALCVVSADQPLSADEVELYREAAARAGQLLFVLTKADRLSVTELGDALRFVVRTLRLHGHALAHDDVLAVSAVDGRGIDELRARLGALNGAEGSAILERATRRLTARAAAELARGCELEARALRLPLEELRSRAQALNTHLARLEDAHADARDVMERRVTRMLTERVNVPLQGYARAHDATLQAALGERAQELDAASPSVLAAALDAWIDDAVMSRFTTLAEAMQAQVASDLDDIAASHMRRIEELLAAVRRAADDALGLDAVSGVPSVALEPPARFTFKLHDPRHALDILVTRARRALPGALGRRLVLADARARLRALIDRHAGRLRAELVACVDAAVLEHRRKLDDAMSEACAGVRAAIGRAEVEHRQGADHVRARLRELHERRERALAVVDAVSD